MNSKKFEEYLLKRYKISNVSDQKIVNNRLKKDSIVDNYYEFNSAKINELAHLLELSRIEYGKIVDFEYFVDIVRKDILKS